MERINIISVEELHEIRKDVPAEKFVHLIASNVDNEKMTDSQFRKLVRCILPCTKGCDSGKKNNESFS